MEFLLPVMLLGLVVIMLLGMRRQKREMNKISQMQDNLAVGDRVMTTSGLYGTVSELGEDTVNLTIADGITTTWSRQAIREVVEPQLDGQQLQSPEIESDTPAADGDGIVDTTKNPNN